jgi:hypothetical protein
MRGFITLVGLAALAACGNDGATGDDEVTPDAPTIGTWVPLIQKSWTLAPGGENTSDLQIDNTDRAMVIGGIRPLAPQGTHHTLLFRGVSATNVIYASGVGTNELMFPPGKGMKLEAGAVLGLQLHTFNTSDATISGVSGVEIMEVDPNTVTEEVDVFLPGPRNLALGPNKSTTQAGTCTVKQPYTLFALFPHMHQLGTHFKTTIHTGGADRVIHDAAYNFEHQEVISLQPIEMKVGDTITTECTWNNPGGSTVGYGESSTTEMCYSILYRYPRGSDEFCTQ